MNKYIFSIEGNIGSGKSTLVDYLKNNLEKINKYSVIYLKEPVDTWNTVVDPTTGKTILELYYIDQKKYAFSFQMMAYISRLSQLKNAIRDAPDHSIIITERCLDTDYNIFTKMLYDSEIIEPIELAIYRKWFNEFNIEIAGFIYLQTDPETCFNRIITRNRKGEENITNGYLDNCHEYHQRWLLNNNSLILNADKYTDHVVIKIMNFILQFIR